MCVRARAEIRLVTRPQRLDMAYFVGSKSCKLILTVRAFRSTAIFATSHFICLPTNIRTHWSRSTNPALCAPNITFSSLTFRGHDHFRRLAYNCASTSPKDHGTPNSDSTSSLPANMRSNSKENNGNCNRADNTDENDDHTYSLCGIDNDRIRGPYSRLLTVPNLLTISRISALPVLVYAFYMGTHWGRLTTSIFIAAATTDWLDGYLARKFRMQSSFGAFLDPVADKLMVAITLILLCSRPFETAMFGQGPWLLTVPTIIIISREIIMSAVREWAGSHSRQILQAVAVDGLGKWKTATQMVALTLLLAARDARFEGAGYAASSGVVLLYVSAILSVMSFATYMNKIRRVFLK